MAKVILLEDNLKRAGEFADQLNQWRVEAEKEQIVTRILLYDNSMSSGDVGKLPEIKPLKEKGIDVEWVNIINFNHVLDRLYEETDNLFIFDTYLLSDKSSAFRYRVNVSFALNHIEDKKIWFYTTAGQEIKDNIDNFFGDNVMEVKYADGEYSLRFVDCPEFVQYFE